MLGKVDGYREDKPDFLTLTRLIKLVEDLKISVVAVAECQDTIQSLTNLHCESVNFLEVVEELVTEES